MSTSTFRLPAFLVSVALLVSTTGFTEAPVSTTAPTSSADFQSSVDFHPMQQMFLLKKVKPDVQRIGVIWKKGVADQEAKLEAIRRAVATIQGKLFVAYVESKADVGGQFRQLARKHDVQALWVVENDGIVDAAAPRQYLIENAAKSGIPLLAPTEDWVSAGAPMAVRKEGDIFRILLNEPAANATSIKVPAKYKSQTKLIAAK